MSTVESRPALLNVYSAIIHVYAAPYPAGRVSTGWRHRGMGGHRGDVTPARDVSYLNEYRHKDATHFQP